MNVDMEEQHRRNIVVMNFIDSAISGKIAKLMTTLPALDRPSVWHDMLEWVAAIDMVYPTLHVPIRDAWRGTVNDPRALPILASSMRWSLAEDLDGCHDLLAAVWLFLPFNTTTLAPIAFYRGQPLVEHAADR